MPTFSFSTRRPCPYTWNSKEIIDGVHGVLQRHSVYIRSFYLRCPLSGSCAHTLEQCIYSLGDLGIEKLYLGASSEWPATDFSFSCHLLSHMPPLKYFKLKSFSLQPNLKSQCNSLRTLRLSNVRAPPGSLECILSNCLSLCTLTIKKCQVPSKLCFRGPNLQLKCIAIHGCEALEEIEFEATSLTTFDFEGDKIVKFIFDHVPQLHTIYISSYHDTMPYFCGRLGEYLPRLKTLLYFDSQDGSIAAGIKMFNNLKRLELASGHLITFNLFSLTSVLHACPRLQEFHFSVNLQYEFYEWPEEEKNVVFHSQLKYVELSGFGARESEVRFASYILKSAIVLQQMFISWVSRLYMGLGKWSEGYDPALSKEWSQALESIEQMKHQAVSKTAQVIFQQSPRLKSKQF
ncbi:hypothetical protein PHJA_002453200 [Phtheirospermum japonicum]|uniref:At1g61320/AtMIF1 LRR domain-containing protein n=1 Tax=Phtheirospermum japonicum TaxID=374723 RepID=A0A830D4C4_9LAMI|nr:hypothetical protein PHJA_002453200 [Phtheirospermum japonicum]